MIRRIAAAVSPLSGERLPSNFEEGFAMTLFRSSILTASAAVLCGVLAATPALADGPSRTITVTGQGQAFGTPDTAMISAGVQSTARTAAQALSENAGHMNAVF